MNWLYPPFCPCCEEKTERIYFCDSCWQELTPLAPFERCRICFSEKTEKKCPCLNKRLLFLRAAVFDKTLPALYFDMRKEDFTKEIASFFLYQWSQLSWELPDWIVWMPGMKRIAEELSFLLNVPLGGALVQKGTENYFDGALLEEKTVLLLDDCSPFADLKKAADCLIYAFTKKIFQLSFIHYDYFFD